MSNMSAKSVCKVYRPFFRVPDPGICTQPNMDEVKTPVKRKGVRKPVLSDSERKRRKRERGRMYDKMRIYIGGELERWLKLKEEKSFATHSAVAKFLMDYYESSTTDVAGPLRPTSTPATWKHQLVKTLSDSETESETETAALSGIQDIKTSDNGSDISITESSVEIIVENLEKDADDTSYLSEDSETDKEINKIVNHAKGLNCHIKLTDKDTENFTNNENCRKSSRVQTRGFRPNYASLEWEDSSDSDSIKDDVNNIKQDIKLETEDHQNGKTIGIFLNDFSDKVKNALNERMKYVRQCKKISKEEDPDFILSDDDAKDLSDSEESIDINVRDSCDDGTPKDVQNENLESTESNSSKQKLYRKRKKKEKDETESAKKSWIHIKLEDHQDKYGIETVKNFERKNRNSNLTEELYTCLLCGCFKSTAKDVFEEHVEKHVNRVLECDQCTYVGHTRVALRKHRMSSGHMCKGQKYICDICGMVSYRSEARLTHMGKEHGDPQFKCKFCDEKFVTKGKRMQHTEKVHYDEAQYCKNCEKDFPTISREEFRQHKNKCQPGHQCQLCGTILVSKDGLKRHLRSIHMGVREFQCHICQYAAKCSKRHREHMMTHSSVHPYSCDRCPFTCVQAYQLKSHMRTHSGEKPFKCTQCKFAAAWNVQLKYHMSVHELESSVMCQQCDVLFKNEKALKMHEKKDHSASKMLKARNASK